MKRREYVKKALLSLYSYLCFFLLMAFIITCCMMLFLSLMTSSMGIRLDEGDINTAAKLTFLNVVFLAFVCTVIDALRRRITIDRPVKIIADAADKIAKGDFSARIPQISGIGGESALRRVAECFNKMARELSALDNMQSDFISNVSHELKTPIAVIKNYSTLLSSPDLTNEEREKYIVGICSAVLRLDGLVSNILRLSKLENKEIFPSKERFDLGEQLTSAILEFEKIWEDKDIDIEADIEEGIEIFADQELLLVVWRNLISNALKFTDMGGKVSVSLKSEGGCASVCVRDTGCGIPPEVGKRIFDKFYQADSSRASEGNGLGLALVKRICDITGAEISVDSEAGIGSTFTVRIRY